MRFCTPRASALPIMLLFLSTLTACSSDGGNQTVYFSINDHQGAIFATVLIDLTGPDQEVARNPDGTVQCTLDPALAARGCTLSLDAGDEPDAWIRAEVSDCWLPVVVSLFSCNFVKVDVSALEFGPSDNCGAKVDEDSCYVHGICDVCASTKPDRKGCEECDNTVDDDGDGNADCDDPDCELTEECGFGRTTVTCSTLTTTTSTTSSTTVPAAISAPISTAPEEEESGESTSRL